MEKIYSLHHPHPAVFEELKDIWIPEDDDGEEVVAMAEAITKQAAHTLPSRWKKAVRFIFEGMAYGVAMVDRIPPKMPEYDPNKLDEDEFNR